MALLATLQYRWLGRISEAERDRMQCDAETGAVRVRAGLRRELTRAYLLFQIEPRADADDQRDALRRALRSLAGDVEVPAPHQGRLHLHAGPPGTGRLDISIRRRAGCTPVDWPASMSDWRSTATRSERSGSEVRRIGMFIRRMSQPIWETAPAVVSPMPLPLMFLTEHGGGAADAPRFSFTRSLALDRGLHLQRAAAGAGGTHFTADGGGLDFQVAVVSRRPGRRRESIRRSAVHAGAGARRRDGGSVQVRTQDFSRVASEVRRFTRLPRLAPPMDRRPGTGKAGRQRRDRDPLKARVRRRVVQPGSGGAGGRRRAASTPSTTTARSDGHATELEADSRPPLRLARDGGGTACGAATWS